MPSTSPGNHAPSIPSSFEQILPGKPFAGYQSLTTFTHRHKRYVAYISGKQLSILSSPTTLLQAITFGESLVSVTAEVTSGKLAIATKEAAWVLEPVTEGWTKIWWERALYLRKGDPGDEARWLSWGGDGELLVGGSRHLSLFSTVPSSRSSSPPATVSDGGEAVEERTSLWSKAVSSPVRWAAFSPSANLIATCGERDRLVKIWRRLSFEEGLFDHTFLPHAGAVTHLQWRPLEEVYEERRGSGRSGRHDDDPEVLYTIANDGVLRVWRTGNIHDLDILVLHTTVNLVAAIPQSPSLSNKASAAASTAKSARYAFTIPSFHLDTAVKAAIGLQTPDAKLSHSLEHLKEVSSKEPDIVVTLDGHGRMSAWGLQSIGHKRRPETPSGLSKQAFHIAHCEDLPVRFQEGENAAFQVWFEDSTLNVLSHTFDGEIVWWKGETETFFSPSTGGIDRLRKEQAWTGLEGQTTGVRVLAGHHAVTDLVCHGINGAMSRWSTVDSSSLRLVSAFTAAGDVVDAAAVHASCSVVSLEGSEPFIILRDDRGQQLARPLQMRESGGLYNSRMFSVAPSPKLDIFQQRFIVLSTDRRGVSRGCSLTIARDGAEFEDIIHFSIDATYDGADSPQLAAILDAAQPDRFGVVALTNDGELQLFHIDVTENDEAVEPVLMATYDSGVKRARTWVASNDFAALASNDGHELTIIDLRNGYIEHGEKLKDRIKHLCPSSKQNVLAIGYEKHADILAQGHYGTDRTHPTWHHIKQISVAGTGLSISSLGWLGDGRLAIAAGNGMFVSSDDMLVQDVQLEIREALDLEEKENKEVELPRLTGLLKTPYAIWHPRLLIHLVHCGRWSLAVSLVVRLLEKLKFWSEGDHLDPHLQTPSEQLYGAHGLQLQRALDEEVIGELHQQLEEKNLPQLSNSEQAHLRRVLDAMLFCAEHVKGLDDCALRFLFAWKLSVLNLEAHPPQTNGTTPNGIPTETPAPLMHWREIAFAHQSTTQQPLLDILTFAYDNKISWRTARNLGLFAWLSDFEALTQIFEALAQTAYRASSPPDPIDASLYFLALHKKSTLLGLWRIATWHREQKATMNFLRRDFAVEANRTAARKNAYALMGKRRFDYAAAFFLLAEDAASATSVLAGQCGDVMLAIAVARLYAGDGSPVLRKLVEDRLLPDALAAGNRWQASWCHSILFERQQAAEALVRPLTGVRSWESDDPHSLTLYKQLRKQESQWEWEAVLRAARLLRKMGLWFAAVELVRGWEFRDPKETLLEQARTSEEVQTNGVAAPESTAPPSILDDFTSSTPAQPAQPPSMLDDFSPTPVQPPQPPSMLDGFASSSPAPQKDEKASREAKAAELLKQLKAKKESASEKVQEEKRQPTQFQEPSADSLLDSFGF